MIIDCISDLHGHYPQLEDGDLLIVAGDLTANHTVDEFLNFCQWMDQQNYEKKILIAGNHDTFFVDKEFQTIVDTVSPTVYLCDSGTGFTYYDDRFPEEDTGWLPSGKRTINIWGSPWTLRFPGMNPSCMAFTCETEEELAEKWALIPDDVDILVTHSPPWGLRDGFNAHQRLGSTSLLSWTAKHVKTLRLNVFGHIHEGYGIFDITKWQKEINEPTTTIFVNASQVNERYEPINKPIRIEL